MFLELFLSIKVFRVSCVLDEAILSGRPKATLVLTNLEREELKSLALRRKTAQALALRPRIVLACVDGKTTKWWLSASASPHRW